MVVRRRHRRRRTTMFDRRGILLVSSTVVLVEFTIAGGMLTTFKRSLPRRRGSRWVGCTIVSDVVGWDTRLRIVMRYGVSRGIATSAVTMDILLLVAASAVANRVVR